MKFFNLLIIGILCTGISCAQKSTTNNSRNISKNTPSDVEVIKKTDQEWKDILTKEEYYILRKKGTERAGSSELLNIKEPGIYVCAACELPLFPSDTKFKSGTGWPSFYKPIEDQNITEITDNSLGMRRVEVICSRCHGHLGHVFEDGPKPTGLRYCINGDALDFIKD